MVAALIGKVVKVVGGAYHGYRGRVKNESDTHVQVGGSGLEGLYCEMYCSAGSGDAIHHAHIVLHSVLPSWVRRLGAFVADVEC